jgi:hypothetical protein
MGYQKKLQKWAASVGLPNETCFWVNGDSAPLKEFYAKLLSSEILRVSPDIAISNPIPFEKVRKFFGRFSLICFYSFSS